jgi:hypothetical protein
LGAKAGISYQSERGWTASLFDVYRGPIHGYPNTINPAPAAFHLLSSHLRLDLSRYIHADAARHLAFVAHGDNLANRHEWLPDWGDNTGDTIPAYRGRTIYFGLEVSLKKD